MGDRAQVCIKPEDVYLYAHWDGYELVEIVQSALARKQRWQDSEYLARIIFCEMVKDDVEGETGYGIGTEKHGDLQYPVIVVDCGNLTVSIGKVSLPFETFIDNPQPLKEAYNV